MDPSEYYKAAANKMKVTGNMKPSGLENESSSAVSIKCREMRDEEFVL